MSCLPRRHHQQGPSESLLGLLPLPYLRPEEEEDESILGGIDLTPPAIDIPLMGLSEEELLPLAVKASIDSVQEK